MAQLVDDGRARLRQDAGGGGLFAVGSNAGLWKPVPVELQSNGVAIGATSLVRKARLGYTTSVLGDGVTALFDRVNEVTVELADPEQLLLNADLGAIDAGANLALVGNEVIQFRRAEDLGSGRWCLTELLRGCRGTEWAKASHGVGDVFCLLGAGLVPVAGGAWGAGAVLSVAARGIADEPPLPSFSAPYRGEADKPASPCRLSLFVAAGSLELAWTGRSWEGFGWNSAVDPADEGYQVMLSCDGSMIFRSTLSPGLSLPLGEMPGSGSRWVEVRVASLRNGQLSHDAVATILI